MDKLAYLLLLWEGQVVVTWKAYIYLTRHTLYLK